MSGPKISKYEKSILGCGLWNPSIYNILRWVAWTMGQTNRRPRVWCSNYYFFYTFYRLRAPKTLYFYNFIKKLENKLKGKNFARNHEKKNTWNIRRLVDDWFVPSSKQPSVSYCRLTDLWRHCRVQFWPAVEGRKEVRKGSWIMRHPELD